MKELTYQAECGPEDKLYTFVYEIEPYNPGGRDEPPSGGTAQVYEIRGPDGVSLPDWRAWVLAKIDVEAIEESIYEWHCEQDRAAYESAMEDRADAKRDRMSDEYKG